MDKDDFTSTIIFYRESAVLEYFSIGDVGQEGGPPLSHCTQKLQAEYGILNFSCSQFSYDNRFDNHLTCIVRIVNVHLSMISLYKN